MASAAAKSRAARASARWSSEPVGDQGVDAAVASSRVASRRSAQRAVERVEPEHVEHGAHRRPRDCRAAPSRSPSASSVLPSRTDVVDHGDGRRDAEVVVHRRRRTRRRTVPAAGDRAVSTPGARGRGSPRSARTPAAASSSGLDGELDVRAVVRGDQVVAQVDRRGPARSTSRTSSELPSDLLIFSPAVVIQALCIQYDAKPRPGRARLGQLVLVVREAQVDAAAVDVEGVAEVLARPSPSTRGASPGGPAPHGRGPGGGLRLGSSLRPFHRAKSRGSRLPRGSASSAASMSSMRWRVSSPYVGQRAHVEVHVAGAVVGGVGVPARRSSGSISSIISGTWPVARGS